MRHELGKDWRTVYKLTDKNGRTNGNCQWGKGVKNPHGVRDGLNGLCSDSFYHAYHTRELAVLLNPLGAAFALDNMRLFRAEIAGRVEEDKGILKLGATEMETVEELKLIQPTLLQRSAFSILVGLASMEASGVSIPEFSEWANNWLDGIDRSETAARSAARSAAWSAARSAARSAAWSAAWSAESAAWSAESAAWSAESAARSAARSAESAAWSAESAAWSAARSAESAAWSAARSAARSAGSAARSAESAAWSAARSAESAARSAERSAARSAADLIVDAAVIALAQSWK